MSPQPVDLLGEVLRAATTRLPKGSELERFRLAAELLAEYAWLLKLALGPTAIAPLAPWEKDWM